MDIKTFRASSMQEALRLVRRELGPEAAVLRTREVRAGGVLGLLTGERNIEVEASTEVIVPSRMPKRPMNLDQGLDLTEMAQIRLAADHDRPDEPPVHQRSEPFHLVVAGAENRVGATTVATHLAGALNAHHLRATVWSGDSMPDRSTAYSDRLPGFQSPGYQSAGYQFPGGSPDVLLFDIGSRPLQQFDRLWDVAGLMLLVTTPEPTSILDAYAAIKLLAARQPALRIQIVVNFARDAGEAERVQRQLAQTCRQFLNFEVTSAGFVSRDDAISRAMRGGRLVAMDLPHGVAARQFEQMASQLDLVSPINYLRFVSRKNLKNAESVVTTGRY